MAAGLRQDPLGSAPPDPLAAIWGLLLRGVEEREGEGRGGERKKRKGEGTEGIGE